MTVKELNQEEKLELKERLYYGCNHMFKITEKQQQIIDDSLTSDSIPDDLINEVYESINFVKDDFWCNKED